MISNAQADVLRRLRGENSRKEDHGKQQRRQQHVQDTSTSTVVDPPAEARHRTKSSSYPLTTFGEAMESVQAGMSERATDHRDSHPQELDTSASGSVPPQKAHAEEEWTSPQPSFRSDISLLLDSSQCASLSPIGMHGTVLADSAPNRSGIGSVSMLGGQLLSPIPRASGVGIDEEPNDYLDRSTKSTFLLPGAFATAPPLQASPDPAMIATAGHEDTVAATEDAKDASPASNTSIMSTGSTREEEIQLAQQQVGASAQAFIQGLRGAAHRRKMNLTRSRDSLAAKEKERREDALRIAMQKKEDIAKQMAAQEETVDGTSPHSFRAKLMPKASGTQGASGLYGVPKVAKRQTTTPFSPMLGIRRNASNAMGRRAKATEEEQNPGEEESAPQAHPRPNAITQKVNAGQAGIPKVPKRPTTVPFSPRLGPRRPQGLNRRHSISTSRQWKSSETSDSGCTPVGLAYVPENQENSPLNVERTPLQAPSYKEFHLQSTLRAQKRAVFDEQRKQRWEARQLEETRHRRERIRRLERELGELRWEL